MKTYGLLGRNISYSFSAEYFNHKFSTENIPAQYKNFDISTISEFHLVRKSNENLAGMNVTIPYKEEIIEFLDDLDKVAAKIGAVNTIKFLPNNKLKGYNTDYLGFQQSLIPHLEKYHHQALILGTGGASKAIAYSLQKLNIPVQLVSRQPKKGEISYKELSVENLKNYPLIINCTPLGTSPNITDYPPIPINGITPKHIIFDLIYNPEETLLMKLARKQGADVFNGLKMLQIQAEEAWKIWNSK